MESLENKKCGPSFFHRIRRTLTFLAISITHMVMEAPDEKFSARLRAAWACRGQSAARKAVSSFATAVRRQRSREYEEWLLNREVPYNEVEESKLRTTPGPAWECFPMSHFALLWTTSRNEGLSAISRASSARRQSAKSRVRRVM